MERTFNSTNLKNSRRETMKIGMKILKMRRAVSYELESCYIYIILLKRLSNYRCNQCTARSRRLLKKGKKKKKEASSARGNSINPLYERRSKTGTINNSLPVLSGHPSRRFPPRRRMIYIYTPIEAKSFVTNRLSTDDPGCSTKFRKFRATPCGIIPPPPLSLSLSV